MDAGPVEYVTSADGVVVAYQRFGQGRPILRIPGLGTPLRVWSVLASRRETMGLSPGASTVTWDIRGTGMSDRQTGDFSLGAWLADAVAVAEAVGGPLPVIASDTSGPVGLALAATRRDLVSHLILPGTGPVGSELCETALVRSTRAVLAEDWEFCIAFMSRVVLELEGEEAENFVKIVREELDPEVFAAIFDGMERFNVRDQLSDITAPTLILERGRRRQHRSFLESGRNLSRAIQGAQLSELVDQAAFRETVLAFLDEEPAPIHGAFRSVMFTDLVSSTAITQRVGDDAAQRVVEAHDAAVRAALDDHRGVEIKHTGDGIMAAFDSAADAARAGQQIATQLTEAGVGVRIGLNAGEPIERDGDLFGTSIQLAARIGDRASEGQVLASQVVRDLTAGKGLTWTAETAIEAKGFADPVPVFSLNLD